MVIERGQVVWADFGEAVGSTPAKRRPAVIVQADFHNRSRSRTVVVVPLTSNVALESIPGHVLIEAWVGGLARPSVALTSQVMTLDRAVINDATMYLPAHVMADIDRGLRLSLGL